jgi:hypothetical protein
MSCCDTLTINAGGAWRNGKGSAPSSICQPERRRDQVALSISEANGKTLLHCFKSGCSFVDIANALDMSLGNVQIVFAAQLEAARKQAEYAAAKLAKARSLWDVAKPIAGTKAEPYLRGRGIAIPMPASLRFMPDIFHGPSSSGASAMVADVQPTGNLHRTYFSKQGVRLAQTETAKGWQVSCPDPEDGLDFNDVLRGAGHD